MKQTSIVVFDGVCHLCNAWVRFLLKHDRVERFAFAAMQTDTGRRLLQAHGLDPDMPASFLLLDNQIAYTDSDAILRILRQLGGFWRGLGIVLSCIPRALRDPCYRFIARHRYRLFGRREQCMIPDEKISRRFMT